MKILPFANLNLVPTLCSFKIWQVSGSGDLFCVCFRLPPPPMGIYLQCSARQLNVSLPFLLSLPSLWYHSRTQHMSHVLGYKHVLYIFQYFSQFCTTTNSSPDFSSGLSSISVWVKIYLYISILSMCICIDIYNLYTIFVHFCSWAVNFWSRFDMYTILSNTCLRIFNFNLELGLMVLFACLSVFLKENFH